MKYSKTILALFASALLSSTIFGGSAMVTSFDSTADTISIYSPSSTDGSIWADGSGSRADISGPGVWIASNGAGADEFYNGSSGYYSLYARGGSSGGYAEAWISW